MAKVTNAQVVRNWRQSRKTSAAAVLGGECVDCGEADIRVLTFHHMNPSTKIATVASMLNQPGQYPEEQVLAEIEKCVLLCANCHAKHHCTWEDASPYGEQRLMAVDPGEMTGWATGIITPANSIESSPTTLVVQAYGYLPWKQFVLNLNKVQAGEVEGERPFDIIVYESFRIRATAAKALTGSDVPTAQCIGGIKLSAWLTGAQLVTSEPSNKPVVDRQMGGTEYLPDRDTVEHYRDAVRHAHWYAINKRGVDPSDTRIL